MITKNQASYLKGLIKEYGETMVADSWSGSADPDDYESIRNSHKDAEVSLMAYIAKLTEHKQ